MNVQPDRKITLAVYAVGIIGTFLLMAVLVWLMQGYTRTAPVTQERAEERAKALLEIRAANAAALNQYAWQDQGKEIVRVPVERAMELIQQEWQDPAAGRAKLLERLQVATAKPPEQPSEFE